ncbi:MAG: GEVED domain-containing protein [Bacteroidota bacterium]
MSSIRAHLQTQESSINSKNFVFLVNVNQKVRVIKHFSSILLVVFFLAFSFSQYGQNIRISADGSQSADQSAILELDGSNAQGLYVPQMTETQKNAFGPNLASSPDNGEGMMIYQTDGDIGLYYWEGQRWVKYKPYGFAGIVGNNWDTLANGGNGAFAFSSIGSGFTASEIGTGNYEVNFGSPIDNYPTIVLTPEANQVPLPDALPVPDVTCTPSFLADCTDDFNSDQVEAVRVVSTVTISSAGGLQTQVMQNGVGFLPSLNSASIPVGYVNDTSTPEFVSLGADGNGCSWPQSWMIGNPPASLNAPPAAANSSILTGGCWGFTTDCILQVSDPCVLQNGGGNYGRYLPNSNITANTYCNNIYHPSETVGTQQDNQPTIRIGNNAADHFEVYLESSPHWSDAMAAFIDWNRDGDFEDTGEFLGQIDSPPCTAGQGNPNSGCNGSAQLGAHPTQTSPFIQNGTAGQFTFPTDPSIDVELGLTNFRVYSNFINVPAWDEPCIASVWGETEDYVVEIYDDVVGSVTGLGSDFSYTPTVCGISQLLGSSGNYTGFRVECTDLNDNPINTKFHFSITKNSIY